MELVIKNEAKLAEAIQQYGQAEEKLKELKAQRDALKLMIESYMTSNKLASYESADYKAKMQRGSSSLIVGKGETHADIAKKLIDKGLKQFVVQDYDGAAIKEALKDGNDEELCEKLFECTFKLTDANKHLKVVAKA